MKITYTIVLLMLTASMSASSRQSIDTKKLDEYLSIQQKRLNWSGSVRISSGGKTVYKKNMGMASIELGVPVTGQTIFPVASISKSFTALLVLKAVEENKLRLSDSLSRFFPQLTDPAWRSITIDQLLAHRSGLPHNEGIANYWGAKSLISYDKVPAMKEIFSLKLSGAPGTKTQYSSPGYFVLASILENLYSKSFGQLVIEKISVPLRLVRTGQMNNWSIVKDLANGYIESQGKLFTAPYRSYSLMKGSGDLYASADDLITFLNSIASGHFTEIITQQMFTEHSVDPVERGDHYGYGWFIRDASGGRPKAYYHGGGSFGVSALMAMYPKENLSIVLLSNVSVLPVNEIWQDLEMIVLGKTFKMPVLRKELPIDERIVNLLSGTYVAENGMSLLITPIHGKLYGKLGKNPAFELFREDQLEFYGKKVAIDITFELDDDGKASGIRASGMGKQFNFSRK